MKWGVNFILLQKNETTVLQWKPMRLITHFLSTHVSHIYLKLFDKIDILIFTVYILNKNLCDKFIETGSANISSINMASFLREKVSLSFNLCFLLFEHSEFLKNENSCTWT